MNRLLFVVAFDNTCYGVGSLICPSTGVRVYIYLNNYNLK